MAAMPAGKRELTIVEHARPFEDIPTTRGRRGTRRRFLVAGLVIVAAISYMIYAAMQSSSEYYVTAGELKAMGAQAIDRPVRLGGRVVEGSVQRDRGAEAMAFSLTDGNDAMPVVYRGVVPDSFGPGTDVILQGALGADGTFRASNMMTKCASKYEPER